MACMARSLFIPRGTFFSIFPVCTSLCFVPCGTCTVSGFSQLSFLGFLFSLFLLGALVAKLLWSIRSRCQGDWKMFLVEHIFVSKTFSFCIVPTGNPSAPLRQLADEGRDTSPCKGRGCKNVKTRGINECYSSITHWRSMAF